MEDESNAGMILDQSQSHIGLKGSILMQGGGMADQNSANFQEILVRKSEKLVN